MSYYIFDLSWFTVVTTVILLYLIYWYRRPYKFPPGPRGIPILGYLPFFSKRIECDIYKLSQKYGSVMSVRMGSSDAVILNDFESIYKVISVCFVL